MDSPHRRTKRSLEVSEFELGQVAEPRSQRRRMRQNPLSNPLEWPELLERIYSYVEDAKVVLRHRIVCRLFRDVLPSTVPALRLPPMASLQRVACLTSVLTSIKTLDLKAVPRVTDRLLAHIAQHCPSLTEVILASSEIHDQGIQALCDGCPDIKTLELTDCSKITDAAFETIGKTCHHLERLSFGGNRRRLSPRLSDSSLLHIAEGCGSTLRKICVRHAGGITDHGLMKFVRGCDKLTAVGFDYCTKFTDSSLSALAECHASSLRVLSVKNCPNLNDATLNAFAKSSFNSLEEAHFCVNLFSDSAIVDFTAACPSLKVFSMESCHQITDVAIVDGVAAHCKHLRKLVLNGCIEIGDDSAHAVAEGCPELTHVNLAGCRVTEDGVIAIAANCSLESATLSHLTDVGDDAIVAIAERSPNLHTLLLTDCYRVTDRAMVMVANRCPLLAHIDLNNCTQIGDITVRAVATLSKHLTYLLMKFPLLSHTGPSRLTRAALNALTENALRPCWVDISGHNLDVGAEGVVTLANRIRVNVGHRLQSCS